jgi:hypothetical protein
MIVVLRLKVVFVMKVFAGEKLVVERFGGWRWG